MAHRATLIPSAGTGPTSEAADVIIQTLEELP